MHSQRLHNRNRLLRPILCSAIALCVTTSAIAAERQPWELWQVNVDGSRLRPFARTPGLTCGSPDWSPNGKLLAYDTWPLGQPLQASQIAVSRSDGTQQRLIGPGAMPSWSPDGAQIVCHTYNPETIVVMNADGSGREVILDHWGSPRWSPTGNRIASVRNGNIGLYDLATGTERIILRGPYSVRQGFAIAPDGLHFCFGQSDGGIALATLDEQNMRASVRSLVKSGMCHHASFSPDGNRVVFSWQADSKLSQLYLLDLEASEPPRLINGQDPARHNYNPDWSPDGETIVFASQATADRPKIQP
jgi:Tol biopolymer transport system component